MTDTWIVRRLELRAAEKTPEDTRKALEGAIVRIQREGLDMDGKHWKYRELEKKDTEPVEDGRCGGFEMLAMVYVSIELEDYIAE
jgi:hypothetical protein